MALCPKALYSCGFEALVRLSASSTGCYQRKQVIADFIKRIEIPTEQSVGIFCKIVEFWKKKC